MEAHELVRWRERIVVAHRKLGRTMTTLILHVDGEEAPPEAVLLLAANDWRTVGLGQVVRRPDDNGKQVYWVNAFASY